MRKAKRTAEEKVEGAAQTRKAVDRFAALGKEFDAIGWPQASAVVKEVRAVPTCFIQLDAVTDVGGWPTDRFTLVHGPSNKGKSALLLGLLRSFVEKDHFAAYIDAEGTTPATWARQLMGPAFESPLFRAMYPSTYEATVDNVRAWCELVGNLRETGKVDKDTTGVIGLDSIRKLVPKRLLDKLLKEGSEGPEEEEPGRKKKSVAGVDGMNGAAARYKANLNSAWMDELTLLLRQCGVGMVAIGREYVNGSKSSNPVQAAREPDYILGGGQSLVFENSLRVRVVEAFQVVDAEKRLVGFEHYCEVHKTKIGEKKQKIPTFRFHTFAGGELGSGFDRARDLFHLGVGLAVIEQHGAHYSFRGTKLGQGEEKAIAALREGTSIEEIERAIRATFKRQEPAGIEEDDGEPEGSKPARRKKQ